MTDLVAMILLKSTAMLLRGRVLEAHPHIHYTHSMFAQTTHRILIGWLILTLLLAQGMRVCIHAYGAPHIADHAHEVSATHLESTFSVLANHEEEMSDAHITLIGMLKHLSAQPLIAVLLLTLMLILLQTGMLRLAQIRDRIFRPPHGPYFSPPLRAPPR